MMATDNSNKIKTKRAIPDVNTDAGSDNDNGLYIQQDQDRNDSDSDVDEDTGTSTDINEALNCYDEVSTHVDNDNLTGAFRAVKGLYEYFRTEDASREHSSTSTLSSPRLPCRQPRHVSAVSTRGRRKLPSSFFSTPKLRHLFGSGQIPQVSPPTPLNLQSYTTPMPTADNVTLGIGAGSALEGVNKVMYRKAPPPNLDYNIIRYETTIVEMATYIPLAYLWSGGFLSRVVLARAGPRIVAKMMLWARGLDNGTNSEQKLENLRTTMQHQIMKYGNSTSTDKTASSWTHMNNIFTKATPSLIADVALLRLRHGVTRLPQGQHRGRLTTAIEHAHAHDHWDFMISQVEQYIQHLNLGFSADLAQNADKLAIEDFQDVIWAATH